MARWWWPFRRKARKPNMVQIMHLMRPGMYQWSAGVDRTGLDLYVESISSYLLLGYAPTRDRWVILAPDEVHGDNSVWVELAIQRLKDALQEIRKAQSEFKHLTPDGVIAVATTSISD